jgi:hypothetical protein
LGCIWAVKTLPQKYGLTGVWMGFTVFNGIRLVGAVIHQYLTGPLAPRKTSFEQEKKS